MIRYLDNADSITQEQLQGFFVGWPNPPAPTTHLRLLRQSAAVVLAVDDASSAVIGFINAVSDGVLCAYIPLLEVLPAWQGQGIGRQLVAQMLARLEAFYVIDLLCDAEMQPFYAKLGLQPATGMMVRNYARQCGE